MYVKRRELLKILTETVEKSKPYLILRVWI